MCIHFVSDDANDLAHGESRQYGADAQSVDAVQKDQRKRQRSG